jgi:hypothetical protein
VRDVGVNVPRIAPRVGEQVDFATAIDQPRDLIQHEVL